jgi:gamma-glutamylcyclotransferase (GGCT)/AIG2-like uncharacterized protein YtfP
MNDLIFIYGTLLRGMQNPMARRLAQEASFISDATFAGKMYLVYDDGRVYPGVIESITGQDHVFGEIHRLHQPAASFAFLDAYEMCSAQFPHPQAYRRCEVAVKTRAGHLLQTWIYLYQWPVEEHNRVVSGDFREYANSTVENW